MLWAQLIAFDIFVKQIVNYTDVFITEMTLEQSEINTTILVGKDVRLLIKLIFTPESRKTQIETKIY